jgi:hypothetical protein
MALRYEIDAQGAALIFIDNLTAPSIMQPTWPDGSAWSDGEAETWAEQYILSIEDETAQLPGDSPSQPTKTRPEPAN